MVRSFTLWSLLRILGYREVSHTSLSVAPWVVRGEISPMESSVPFRDVVMVGLIVKVACMDWRTAKKLGGVTFPVRQCVNRPICILLNLVHRSASKTGAAWYIGL